MYEAMHTRLGPSHWWPASSPLEMAVGAVLTQNTAWTNVEKALKKLKDTGLLAQDDTAHPDADYASAMLEAPREFLEECLRPSGFFRLKTDRLTALLRFLQDTCNSQFDALSPQAGWSTQDLRNALLAIKGIGPETADSIMLYAAGHPIFVIDAYTRRIFHRHGLMPEDIWYDELQAYFMDVLEPDTNLYKEYHALIVRVAKEWCIKGKPRCHDCPLQNFLEGPHV